MLTVTDLFCGAGGSSSGAVTVPGVVVRMAANHWKLAIETHNTNHPDTDHDCADISQVEPRRYPATDILWASPECTNHSQAKGRKRDTRQGNLLEEPLPDEAAERSRATMWDVVRFAEHHRYRAIVVENVVDAAKWVLWPAWRASLDALGYCSHVVYLNSMHAQAMGMPAPQSRDRLYVVAHQRAIRCPDLGRWTWPHAWCPVCDTTVRAVQAWKNPEKRWGRYRAQYVWRCPNTGCRNTVVEPAWLPAAAAIDWSLPGERIGDRVRPLAEKTRARIAAGLARYARPVTLEAAGNTFERRPGVRTWPVDGVLTTVHTTASKGVAYGPGMLVPKGHQSLVTWVYGYDTGSLRSPAAPLPTQTTVEGDAILSADLVPDVDECLFRMLEPHEIQAGMAFAAGYVVHGNKRERFRQLGNAVTPPAARDLIAAVVEAITGEAVA